jgi:anti-sigma B factor antagonist
MCKYINELEDVIHMEINQTNIDNVPIVSVSGRIDGTTYKDLETILNELIDHNKSEIILDLEEVVYISSVGLRVLLSALKKVRPNKGDVKLVSLQPFVREVFEITGFTKLFSVYPNQREALSGIKL